METMRLTEGPILNRLNSVPTRARLRVEVARSWESKTEIHTGRLEEFFPNTEGPLNVTLLHGGAYSGMIPFAGSSEGIVRISIAPHTGKEILVFDNPRIPMPGYFPPGQIDLSRGDDQIVARAVAMGLYESPEALRAARDAASE